MPTSNKQRPAGRMLSRPTPVAGAADSNDSTVRLQTLLLDAVGQAVIATDVEGRITYWNRCAEAMYGWSASEAIGRNVLDVTATDASLAQAEEIMARLRRGECWSGEF